MPMTVCITRDVPDRTRGFLSSVMPELAPGIYVSGDLSQAVRDRILTVLTEWHYATATQGSVILVWKEQAQAGGIGIKAIGTPKREIIDLDGVLVSKW